MQSEIGGEAEQDGCDQRYAHRKEHHGQIDPKPSVNPAIVCACGTMAASAGAACHAIAHSHDSTRNRQHQRLGHHLQRDSRQRPAPSASRIVISRRRATERAISRLPTFTHAISNNAPVRAVFRKLKNALPYRLRRALAPRAPYVEPNRLPDRPPVPDTPVRSCRSGQLRRPGLGVGARGRAAPPGRGATTFSLGRRLRLPGRLLVPVQMYALSRRWQKEQLLHVTAAYTHVLIEAERPVLGTRYGSTVRRRHPRAAQGRLEVALIAARLRPAHPQPARRDGTWTPRSATPRGRPCPSSSARPHTTWSC